MSTVDTEWGDWREVAGGSWETAQCPHVTPRVHLRTMGCPPPPWALSAQTLSPIPHPASAQGRGSLAPSVTAAGCSGSELVSPSQSRRVGQGASSGRGRTGGQLPQPASTRDQLPPFLCHLPATYTRASKHRSLWWAVNTVSERPFPAVCLFLMEGTHSPQKPPQASPRGSLFSKDTCSQRPTSAKGRLSHHPITTQCLPRPGSAPGMVLQGDRGWEGPFRSPGLLCSFCTGNSAP